MNIGNSTVDTVFFSNNINTNNTNNNSNSSTNSNGNTAGSTISELLLNDFTMTSQQNQQQQISQPQINDNALIEPELQEGNQVSMVSGRLTVLVVDDSILQRNLCRNKLSGTVTEGADRVNVFVNTAENGEKALDVCDISSKMPDVIILDQCMSSSGGKLFGHEVAAAIRRKSQSVIIIGCSAMGEASREFIENGADAVWIKPIPTKQECITQILEIRKMKLLQVGQQGGQMKNPELESIRKRNINSQKASGEWSHIKLNLASPLDYDDNDMAFSDISAEGMIGVDIHIQKAASISTMSAYSE